MGRIKEIEGYDGLYQIDETGNVFSLIQTNSRRKGLIKPDCNSAGYLRVNLYDKFGKTKKHFVHRLVAETFIPNPNYFGVVNHKDCNKQNNNVNNLEWCTQKQNIQHSRNAGKQKQYKTILIDRRTNKQIIFTAMSYASYFFGKYENYINLKRKRLGNEFVEGSYLVKVVI